MEKGEHPLKESTLKGIIAGLIVLSFVLILMIAAASTQLKEAQYRLQESRRRSMEIASEQMEKLSGDLVKAMYAGTSPKLWTIATRVVDESSAAKAALTWLPENGRPMENTAKFLTQTGDYAKYLSKKLAEGQPLTLEDRTQLQNLREYADQLAVSLDALALSGGEVLPEAENPPPQIQGIEDGFAGCPTLIYDGPFSDHLLKKSPSLTGSPVTEAQARQTAEKACRASLPSTRLENSKLSCYVFHDGKSHSVAVTKTGGKLCYYVSAKGDNIETKLPRNQAESLAKTYLEQQGYPSMTPTYSENTDGILTVNLAYEDNNILCYTDLIKVEVSMDTGEIVGMDARGYLMNHKPRTFPTPKISETQAKTALSPLLTVEKTRLALIPTKSGAEVLTYEFLCHSPTGDKVLSYINVETGAESELLLLLDTEGGQLTK